MVPILKLLPGLLKTAAKALGIDIESAAKAIVGEQFTPEQQIALDAALKQHEAEMFQLGIEEMKVAMSESLAMIQSTDKYVARARPTGLYIFYAVSAALAIGMLFGIKVDPTAVLTILGPLGGVGGMYVYKRTTEKLNGNGQHD